MNETSCSQCLEASASRRDFLSVGSLGLLGISLGQYLGLRSALGAARGSRATAQACILLWLEGGPPQTDTWDPKPNSSFKAISTNVPGIQISELFPKVAQRLDKVALIRSVETREGNHPQGTYESMTGHRPSAVTQFPSLGSIVAKEKGRRNQLPAYVMINKAYAVEPFSYDPAFSSGFLDARYSPLVLEDPHVYGNSKADRPHEVADWANLRMPDLSLPKSVTPEMIADGQSFLSIVDQQFRRREKLAEFSKMDTFRKQALSMILSGEVKRAFDLSQESERVKKAYGANRVGQSVLLARRLVEGGCRFVTAAPYKTGQWDTHGKNDTMMKNTLAPSADQAISVLLDDLSQRGLLDTTLVVVMGEFGRTPDMNPFGGRDHWPHCWSLVMAGGGIRGGRVIGTSDEKAAYVADRRVSIGDVFATIYKALGIDWSKTYETPSGRPVYIANALDDKLGSPIEELL